MFELALYEFEAICILSSSENCFVVSQLFSVDTQDISSRDQNKAVIILVSYLTTKLPSLLIFRE